MENKPVNQKPRKKNEFRYHDVVVTKPFKHKSKIIRHPAYVFLEKDDMYVYVPITHSQKVQNLIVIKLRKNPNPNDERNSYVVIDIKEDPKHSFGDKLKGWSIDPEDEKEIREEYKKLDKQNQALI